MCGANAWKGEGHLFLKAKCLKRTAVGGLGSDEDGADPERTQRRH